MKAIFVYAPDRVGKTTEINLAINLLEKEGVNAQRVHFGPPEDDDSTGLGQYYKFFDGLPPKNENPVNVYFFDRGHGEAPFYEWSRRGRIVKRENLLVLEMAFLDYFSPGNLHNIVLNAPWSMVYDRHMEELKEKGILFGTEECCKYMSNAALEHLTYYISIEEYLNFSCFSSPIKIAHNATFEKSLLYDLVVIDA